MELNGTLLIQLGFFLFLLAWLSGVLFGPLLELFEERERRIDGAKEEARQYKETAGQRALAIDGRLQDAQKAAREILADLKSEASHKERSIVEEAREQANAKLQEARQELESQMNGARQGLTEESEKIAQDMVVKILGRHA